MREGWHNDDYPVLFDETEISAASNRYAIAHLLPGYDVVGLHFGFFIPYDHGVMTMILCP
jgi:hypothetical protein